MSMIAQDAGDKGTKEYSARYGWYVVFVLMIMQVLAYVDRQILVMIIDPIRQDLAISDVQISLLAGFAFAFFFAVCGLPLGWLADRYNRKLIISISVIFWSLATAACGLAKGFGQLFMGRVAVGVGEAGLIPASYSIVSDIFPPRRLTFAVAIMALGSPIGMGSSYLIAGLFASWVAETRTTILPLIGEVQSWQAVFIAVGLPGPVLALLLLTIREPRRKGSIKTVQRSDAQSKTLTRFMRDHWQFFLCHILGVGISSMGGYAVFTWAPVSLMRVFGWSGAQTGAIFGLVVAASISIATIGGGLVVSHFYNKGMKDAHIRLFVYSGIFGSPLVLIAYATGSAWVFLAGTFLLLAVISNYAVAGFALMQIIAPNEFRGRLVALLMLSSTVIGSGLGPLFVAIFTDYVFRDDMMVGWSLGIALLIVYPAGALLFWNAARHMRRLIQPQNAPINP